MPQVNVPLVSKNNLQTLLPVGLHLRTCTLQHGYFFTVIIVDQLRRQMAHKELPEVVLFTRPRIKVLPRGIRPALNKF